MKVTDKQLIKAYQETGSSHKVAVLFNISRRESAERLKNLGVLRTKSKTKMSDAAKQRIKQRNPNYKHGEYVRRPRDFKIVELKPIRNAVFQRDKHTCQYCHVRGGHLKAHHILPYWVKQEAFLDIDNIITVCNSCHFIQAHNKNWACFDINLVNDLLLTRYDLDRERLSEMAFLAKRKDAIVRSSDINETEERVEYSNTL